MHRLFFAIFPDPAALLAIERVVAQLQDANALRGRWIAPEKYHLTVRFLGDYDDDHAADAIDHARRAGTEVAAAAFALVLDRVTTFRGRYRAPCVLRCSRDCETQVQALWQQLGQRLAAAGVADGDGRRFMPHLTIAYADRNLEEAIAVEPVQWQFGELALVDSHESDHRVVARWPALTC